MVAAVVVVVVLAGAIIGLGLAGGSVGGLPASSGAPVAATSSPAVSPPSAGGTDIRALFDARRSGVEVDGSGTVARVLPDDDDGSRHQRFVLALPDGLTVLVAHNIDIAPRLDGLGAGDAVAFRGEYVWSEQGGTVHWTHHDPGGRHADGWLRWSGRTYG